MSKTLVGIVASDKPDKTIVVRISSRKTHPLYRKKYTVSRRIAAHDEKNEAKVGDRVAIVECRPLSATKRFKLDKIIEKPALRADSLAAAKSEDTGRKASKAKAIEDAEEVKK